MANIQNNCKVVLFVEGSDDSSVWYEVIKKHGDENCIFTISFGGTNFSQLVVDLIYSYKKILSNKQYEKIIFVSLTDYDDEGEQYQEISLENEDIHKSWTLYSLNIPEYYRNDDDGSIEIENLLFNSKSGDFDSVGNFLRNYQKNWRNYEVINKAYEKLIEIINQHISN